VTLPKAPRFSFAARRPAVLRRPTGSAGLQPASWSGSDSLFGCDRNRRRNRLPPDASAARLSSRPSVSAWRDPLW